jgi:hypothetical protein
MIIRSTSRLQGILDLSSLERLQEQNPMEGKHFRTQIRPNQSIEVDDQWYSLINIQSALRAGYIEIFNYNQKREFLPINNSFTGTTTGRIAGENILSGDVIYYDNKKIYKARANSEDTMICVGIATENIAMNNEGIVLLNGYIQNSSRFSFNASGKLSESQGIVYVSDSEFGGVTQTRPSTSGSIIQIIGYATMEDILYFNPDYTNIELC